MPTSVIAVETHSSSLPYGVPLGNCQKRTALKRWLSLSLTLICIALLLGHNSAKLSVSAAPDSQATSQTTGSPFPGLSGKLAFIQSNPDNTNPTSEIYVMNADGSNPHPITRDGVVNWYPAFSPDGKQIAFYTHRNDTDAVYVMNADGSDEKFVAKGGSDGLSWSPDGKQLVFATSGGVNLNLGIYKVDIDGHNLQKLVVSTGLNIRPNWSPDGKYIMFQSTGNGTSDYTAMHIYLMDVDGNNQHRLVSETTYLTVTLWSPDSQTVAYARYLDTGNPESGLTLVNLDGSIKGHIGTSNDVDYVWSPDGKYIAAWAINTTHIKQRTSDLVIMNADGSNRTVLAHFDKFYRLLSWGK